MSSKRFAFDLDDTCTPAAIYYHLAIVQCVKLILDALGRACPHPKDLIDFHQKLDIKRMEEHAFHPDRFPASWVLAYEHFAQKSGLTVDPRVSLEIFRAGQRFQEGPFDPLPGVTDALGQLRQAGHELFLVTAGEKAEDLQHQKIRESGLTEFFLPDHIFITGIDKEPAMKKIFNGYRRQLCWMVGDSIKHDIRPGKRLGAWTVQVLSNAWSFQQDKRVKPHFTIQTMTELLKVIER